MKSKQMKVLALALSLFLVSPCWAGVDLNGDADYLTVSDSASLEMSTVDFAIAGWVKASVSAFTLVVCKGLTPGTGNTCGGADDVGYGVRISSSTNFLSCYISEGSGGGPNFTTVNSTTNVNDGAWHHFVCNYDRSGNVSIHIDGGTAEATSDITAQSGNISNSADLAFGRRDRAAGNAFLDGIINENYIWKNTLLTQAEIELLGKSKVKRIGLQIQPDKLSGAWFFDDHPGGTALGSLTFKDSSGNGNNATDTDADGDSFTLSETVLSYP